MIHARRRNDAKTEITLQLVDNEQIRAQWPHATRLQLTIIVGETLEMRLATTNLGKAPIQIGEALHTYLQIGDIGTIQVSGLDGVAYHDKVDSFAKKTQRGAIRFDSEVDRVYINTQADCVIEDPQLHRRIRIAKSGSDATVVWSPWLEKAQQMGDMGRGQQAQGGWREMVCVESVNAMDNVVSIAPGATHTLTVTYSVEPL